MAKVLDIARLDRVFYGAARRYAIERLNLAKGDVVLDLFSGTGVNFPLLWERIGREGRIVAVDGSAAMLRRASAAAVALPEGGGDVRLLQADFSTRDGVARVEDAISQSSATRVLFTLGLTCLPGWREFFRSVYEAAPLGARFSILDVYCERSTLGARLINWTAAADCTQPVWRELEERSAGFERKVFHPYRVIDAEVFVASGTKTG